MNKWINVFIRIPCFSKHQLLASHTIEYGVESGGVQWVSKYKISLREYFSEI